MNDYKHQETPNNSVENPLESLNTEDSVEADVNEIVEKQSNVTKNVEEFQIFIKMCNGKTRTLTAKSTYKISKVLQILGENEILENVRLSYAGIQLQDELTLGYYDISKEATLFLHGRISGGEGLVIIGKFSRLNNLFRHHIRGRPDRIALLAQLNALTYCDSTEDLKQYDVLYPRHDDV